YIQSTDMAFFTVPPDSGNFDDTVERMRITDTGNVGIGTTSPGRKFEVYGGSSDTFIHVDSNDNYKSGIEFAEQGFGAYDKVFRWGVKQYYDGVDDVFHIDPVRDTVQNTGIALKWDGSVGIGTTSPAQKLQVAGIVKANDGFQSNNVHGTGTASYHPGGIYVAKAAAAWIYPPTIYLGDPNRATYDQTNVILSGTLNVGQVNFKNNGGVTQAVFDKATGYIGIGTTNPGNGWSRGGQLHVNGGNVSAGSISWNAWIGADGVIQSPNGGGIGIKFQHGNNNKNDQGKWAGIAGVAESDWSNSVGLAFYTSGSNAEKMRIMNNGNVGIGTTNIGVYRLNVAGVIASSPGAGGILRIGSGSSGDALFSGSATTGNLTINASNTVGGNIIFQSRSVATMEIDGSTGNIGIGTSPSPSYKLNVAGGDINVSYGSDSKKIVTADEKLALATDRIGLDVAELFQTKEEVEVGDVVVVAQEDRLLTKSSKGYQEAVVGVVSGAPALLFEGSALKIGANSNRFDKGTKPPVALAGRIPVKVSLLNGTIKPGDYLTTSSAPGIAMKATEPGMTIGVALESYDGASNNKILVFLNLGEKNVGSLMKELQQKDRETQEKLNELDQRLKLFEHLPLW
ncbi:MAG: hypothetical protein Q8P56_05545, partial [Candidatus Uhrbacteria bacterium]|nr:hypothetical protein [Candidatus Uhrbacteria bacterium]